MVKVKALKDGVTVRVGAGGESKSHAKGSEFTMDAAAAWAAQDAGIVKIVDKADEVIPDTIVSNPAMAGPVTVAKAKKPK